MKVKDYVNVAENFQASVNIDFDLNDSEKLLEYVPTSDICDVLGSYVDNLLKNKNNATFLVGPYGKGKSFLTLALLQLTCGISNKHATSVFINKVTSVRPELAKKLQFFEETESKFIPIVVNSDYDNLKQSFMVALKNGLSAAGLDNLIPKSSYDLCRGILQNWMNDPTIAQGRLSQCSMQTNLKALDEGLKNYSPTAYAEFVQLYDCVTIGLRFNPLVDENVPKLFAEVSAEVKKYGYKGLIVVFDEFSKFLESKSKKLTEDLKFIQDFAEKACRSDEHYSLHLCCIAHRPISQYGEKNSKLNDLLKTVDGRFVTLRFHRGMKENIELIANVISKTPDFDHFFSNFYNEKKWLFEGFDSLNLLDKDDDLFEFCKGCYPLSPLAGYSLVRVSELIAQNERTLFTFLSGNDSTGLRRMLSNDAEQLIGVQDIFDYFSDLFAEDPSQHIKNACYSANSSLTQCEDAPQTAAVKSLAIIKIIDDYRSLKPTAKTISLSTGFDESVIALAIKDLIAKGIIRVTERDGTIDFSFAGSKEINDRAELLLNKELRRIKPLDYLNEITSSKYLVPNKYNAVHRIVRFAKFYYLDYSSFLSLSSMSSLGRLPYDVLIVRLLGENIDESTVLERVKSINDPKIIVQIPRDINYTAIIKYLRYYAAYQKMIDSEGKDYLSSAIPLVISECKDEILAILKDSFETKEKRFFHCTTNETNPVDFVNRVFEDLYCESPYVNNEMLNRNIVTAQYRKARNDVVDFLLANGANGETWAGNYSESSAQHTIWRIFVQCVDEEQCKIRPVIELIKSKLGSHEKKVSAKSIIREITAAPMGVRMGVVPLFLATAISELNTFDDSSVTMFFRDREIELNSINLEKASQDFSDNYAFVTNSGAKERSSYVSLIIEMFSGERQKGAKENAQYALKLCKGWFNNLPDIVRTGDAVEYPKSFNDKESGLLRELKKFDLNPTDFLFGFLPKNFQQPTLALTVRELSKTVSDLAKKEKTILDNEFDDLAGMLGFAKGSLLSGFKDFLAKKNYKFGDLIGNSQFVDFAEYIAKSNSYADSTFIQESSSILLGQYFSSWTKGSKALYISKIVAWKDFVEAAYAEERRAMLSQVSQIIQNQPPVEQISPLAHLLESRIRDAIRQFGGSVTQDDVTYVLTSILNNREGD